MLAIRTVRERRGITQTELAAALKVTQGAVSQWEAGKVSPSVATLIAIANLFKCSVDDLINGESA